MAKILPIRLKTLFDQSIMEKDGTLHLNKLESPSFKMPRSSGIEDKNVKLRDRRTIGD